MHIQFAELPAHDQTRAKQFYIDNLGCQVAADTPMGGDGWRWVELKLREADTTLHPIRARATMHRTDPFSCSWMTMSRRLSSVYGPAESKS